MPELTDLDVLIGRALSRGLITNVHKTVTHVHFLFQEEDLLLTHAEAIGFLTTVIESDDSLGRVERGFKKLEDGGTPEDHGSAETNGQDEL